MRSRHKYTQDYPSERKDYPSSARPPRRKPAPSAPATGYHPVEGNPEEGGKISPADAERISSEDFPGEEPSAGQRKKAA